MAVLDTRATRKRIRLLGLESSNASSFAFREKSVHLVYAWHAHSRHQLLYSLSGRIVLETSRARWLLPPQRAAWIPAGMRHRTTLDRSETISVYFRSIPRGLRLADIRILSVNALLREMLVHASRWTAFSGVDPSMTPLRTAFFRTLALLCCEWVREELPYRLPVTQDPQVAKAADYLRAHLDSANIRQAARFSGQSERSLRRRFAPALGMNWRTYRLQAAMLQAVDGLLNSRESVVQIALSVGYDSPSAFSKAFAQFAGANPLAFRRSRGGDATS